VGGCGYLVKSDAAADLLPGIKAVALGKQFVSSSVTAFSDIVFNAGYASPVRTPRGRDIMAACGQLKSESVKQRASDKLAELRSRELAGMPH